MKTILVINTGSSSVKFKLFDMPEENLLASGIVESIGEENPSRCQYHGRDNAEFQKTFTCPNHDEAVSHILDILTDPETGVLSALTDIDIAGHRVVHGGERFFQPVTISGKVIDTLETLVDLAPLHMPINIMGIRTCAEKLPNIPQVACFDTAFFHNMPQASMLYPVPLEWYEKYGVRRYGFHGISYQYLAGETSRMLGRQPEELKIIAAHLGNGCSITAIDGNIVRDTSMGFTPLEGLMMGTRSGSFDPAIFPYMMTQTGLSADDLLKILNTKSGLAGISGNSRDMREIVSAMNNGCNRARLAFDMFVHILRKYIGAYVFCMGGVDAVVLSGGIGENSPEIRQAIFKDLSFAGLCIDSDKNTKPMTANGQSCMIHSDDAVVKILVIPANEELMIARSAYLHIPYLHMPYSHMMEKRHNDGS